MEPAAPTHPLAAAAGWSRNEESGPATVPYAPISASHDSPSSCARVLATTTTAAAPSESGRGLVFGTGFALAEPADGGEAATGGGFVCDGVEVGGTISLGPHGQRPGDVGTHLLGGVRGSSEHSGTLVVLSLVGGALGVEPGGCLLPPFRRPFCTLGLVVEAGEFFGEPPHRAVCDESAHRFLGGAGGVVEAPVCRISFASMNCALASAMFSATIWSRLVARPLVMPT